MLGKRIKQTLALLTAVSVVAAGATRFVKSQKRPPPIPLG